MAAHASQIIHPIGTGEIGCLSSRSNHRIMGSCRSGWALLLKACNTRQHWQPVVFAGREDPDFQRKPSFEWYMLKIGRQAEMYYTSKLQEVLNRVMPTFSDKESLEITCGIWKSLYQSVFLTNYVQSASQCCRLDFGK